MCSLHTVHLMKNWNTKVFLPGLCGEVGTKHTVVYVCVSVSGHTVTGQCEPEWPCAAGVGTKWGK